MKVLVLVGSLRAASFSGKIARAAVAAAPKDMSLEILDGRDLPLFDQDLEEAGRPEAVEAFRDRVVAADALLFVTPEFNYGIPGTLKNAIDWASRPPYRSPLREKPAVIISLSVSPTGGCRAHGQLSSVLSGTLTPLMNAPSLSISAVHEKFDESDTLTDENTQARLRRTLEELGAWVSSRPGDSTG